MIQDPLLRTAGVLSLSLALAAVALPVAAHEGEGVAESRLAEILAGDTPQTVDELRALQRHVQQLAERVLPAVV